MRWEKDEIIEAEKIAKNEGLTSDIASNLHVSINHGNEELAKRAIKIYRRRPKNDNEKERIDFERHVNAMVDQWDFDEREQVRNEIYQTVCKIVKIAPEETATQLDFIITNADHDDLRGAFDVERYEAVLAVAKVDPKYVEPHLDWVLQLVKSDWEKRKMFGCEIVGYIGDESAIQYIEPLIDHEDIDVQVSAKKAIERLQENADEDPESDVEQNTHPEDSDMNRSIGSSSQSPEPNYCTGCGEKIVDDEAAFCPYCGTEL